MKKAKQPKPAIKKGERWKFRLRCEFGKVGTYTRIVGKLWYWKCADEWMVSFTKPLPTPWRNPMAAVHVANGKLLPPKKA